jgi:sugar O-acyltransferase (sialic acid O-acetyltransferase NeuD family)
MTKRIGIFGTSGMAREARDIADALGLSVVFVARDSAELAAFAEHGDSILESDTERFKDMPFVIGIGEGAIRRKIATHFAGKIKFGNLIHPTATFGRGQRELLESRQGIIICAGVRFTCNVSVGDFTIFNLNATISHDCLIEEFVTISPLACILGNVRIKSGAWIGAGATINQGTNEAKRMIGVNTIIGSGAVVLHDCQDHSVYAGVPARKIK